jgi:hypothetical protein
LECGAAVAQVTVNHLVAGSNPAIPAKFVVRQAIGTRPQSPDGPKCDDAHASEKRRRLRLETQVRQSTCHNVLGSRKAVKSSPINEDES